MPAAKRFAAEERLAAEEEERLAAKAPSGYQFQAYTSRDFAVRDFRPTWLIKGAAVQNQPALVGGGKKQLKTTVIIDFCLSLGSGTPFLDQFTVPTTRKTLLLSGESGEYTIQETGAGFAPRRV